MLATLSSWDRATVAWVQLVWLPEYDVAWSVEPLLVEY
jgi:hypothetical protein